MFRRTVSSFFASDPLLIDMKKDAPFFFSPLLSSSPPDLSLAGFVMTKFHTLDNLADFWMLAVVVRGCLLFRSITNKFSPLLRFTLRQVARGSVSASTQLAEHQARSPVTSGEQTLRDFVHHHNSRGAIIRPSVGTVQPNMGPKRSFYHTIETQTSLSQLAQDL